jgi:transcription termination factor NusB
MDIKIDIDKAAVEQQIVNALMQSAIGEEIEKGIKEFFDKREYNETAVQRACRVSVHNRLVILVDEAVNQHKEKIKEMISKQLTDDAIAQFVTKAWEFANR